MKVGQMGPMVHNSWVTELLDPIKSHTLAFTIAITFRLFSVQSSLPLLHSHLATFSSTKLFCCRQLSRYDGTDYDGGNEDDTVRVCFVVVQIK